jgi:Major Facilitator Superfamily
MAILVYTIIEAPSRGWDAALSVAGFGVTAVLVALVIVHERHVRVPMLDVRLIRNLRFSAASAALTIRFFSLMGFIFLITLYFQFLKGYGPLETGVRLLPVAITVGITSVLGTRIAIHSGTKLVVAAGLLSLAGGLAWVATETETTAYATIPGAMIFIGAGIGLTSAPATESIMGAVPAAKAGVGSAINDATRITGGTLGVAVIGSHRAVGAVGHGVRQRGRQLGGEPARIQGGVDAAAFGAAGELGASGDDRLADALHDAASGAFFHGFEAAVLIAAGIAVAGAVMALALIPSQPPPLSAVGPDPSDRVAMAEGQAS